jgi:hypothetical protein
MIDCLFLWVVISSFVSLLIFVFVGTGSNRFRESLQYLEGLVIDDDASAGGGYTFRVKGILSIVFRLAISSICISISIFRFVLCIAIAIAIAIAAIGGSGREDAIDESFVRSDAMLFQQGVDRLGCCSSSFLFLGNVVFDAVSKLGVFFPEDLERLFQRRS